MSMAVSILNAQRLEWGFTPMCCSCQRALTTELNYEMDGVTFTASATVLYSRLPMLWCLGSTADRMKGQMCRPEEVAEVLERIL